MADSSEPISTLCSPKVSYTQAAINVQIPTKEQAILFDSIDGISIKDYIMAVGTITDPSHIRFITQGFLRTKYVSTLVINVL